MCRIGLRGFRVEWCVATRCVIGMCCVVLGRGVVCRSFGAWCGVVLRCVVMRCVSSRRVAFRCVAFVPRCVALLCGVVLSCRAALCYDVLCRVAW